MNFQENRLPRRVALELRNPRSTFLVSLLLFVFVLCVFLPSLQGAFMFFDENAYVLNNPHVKTGLTFGNVLWAFTSLDYANWHPLTWLSHMLDCQLYGLKSWGHHLTSVLLHALNTVLVFLVFRKMTGAGWRSLVVAMLFGLHPLRVESVAWISERKDVLSAMFWLLAMWAYTRFAEESRKQDGRSKLFYGLTLMFFIMGLMSKTMLVTLPCVFLLLDYWPLKRWEQKSKWPLFLEKIPFFLLAIVVSAIAYIAQQKFGAMQEMGNLPFRDRLGNALISYVQYLGKFFWPENLCIYYPHPGHSTMMKVLAAGLCLICIALFFWVQRQQRPYLLVGWFWYLGTLVPVIGLVQLYSQSMADRYTYVPLIGVYFALVWGLCEITDRWRHRVVMLSVIVATAIVICVALTRYEIGFWKDSVTVWSRTIAVTKNNYVAHNCLGVSLRPTQRAAAFREFQEAVRINPNFANAQRFLAEELYSKRLFDEAIVHWQKSLEIDPNSGWAENGLGLVLYKTGKVDEAIPHFQKAVEYEPNNADHQYDLGAALKLKYQAQMKTNQPPQ